MTSSEINPQPQLNVDFNLSENQSDIAGQEPEIKAKRQPIFWLKLIASLLVLVLLGVTLYYYFVFRTKKVIQSTQQVVEENQAPSTTLNPNLINEEQLKEYLPDDLVVNQDFISNLQDRFIINHKNNLYLLTNKGLVQLTKSQNVGAFQVDPNKEFIWWLEIKIVDQQFHNTKINKTNLATLATETVLAVEAEVPDKEDNYNFRGLKSFAISPDGQSLAYAYDGLWLMDFKTGTKTKLADNVYSTNDGSDFKLYGTLRWSNDGLYILATKLYWESSSLEIFDVKNKQVKTDLKLCSYDEMAEKNKIIGSCSSGMFDSFVSIFDYKQNTKTDLFKENEIVAEFGKILPLEDSVLIVLESLGKSNENSVYADILKPDKSLLYSLKYDGSLSLIEGTNDNSFLEISIKRENSDFNKQLSFNRLSNLIKSSEVNKIYLVYMHFLNSSSSVQDNDYFDLYQFDLKNKKQQLLIKGIQGNYFDPISII